MASEVAGGARDAGRAGHRATGGDVIRHSTTAVESLIVEGDFQPIGKAPRKAGRTECVAREQLDFTGFPPRITGYRKVATKAARPRPQVGGDEKQSLSAFRRVREMLVILDEGDKITTNHALTRSRKSGQIHRDWEERWRGPFLARLESKLHGDAYAAYVRQRLVAQSNGGATLQEQAEATYDARMSRLARSGMCSRAGTAEARGMSQMSVGQPQSMVSVDASQDSAQLQSLSAIRPLTSSSIERGDARPISARAALSSATMRSRLEDRARARSAMWTSRTRDRLSKLDRGDYFDIYPHSASREEVRDPPPFPSIAVSTVGLDDRVQAWRRNADRQGDLEAVVCGVEGMGQVVRPPAYDTLNLGKRAVVVQTRAYSDDGASAPVGRRPFAGILQSERVKKEIVQFRQVG